MHKISCAHTPCSVIFLHVCSGVRLAALSTTPVLEQYLGKPLPNQPTFPKLLRQDTEPCVPRNQCTTVHWFSPASPLGRQPCCKTGPPVFNKGRQLWSTLSPSSCCLRCNGLGPHTSPPATRARQAHASTPAPTSPAPQHLATGPGGWEF